MPESTPEFIDQFRIIRQIGRGGMGVVYEVEEGATGRHVALKVLPPAVAADPNVRQRFEREIRTTANLDHPNIVRVFTVGSWGKQPYYTMEYVKGVALDRVVERPVLATQIQALSATGHIGASSGTEQTVVVAKQEDTMIVAEPDKTVIVSKPDEEAEGEAEPKEGDESAEARLPRSRDYFRFIARVMRDSAQAVDHAHRHGVIHRDVKPANILLTQDGQVRVTDFGLALEVDSVSLTRTGATIGTPRYMSPEQLLRRRVRVDARTDVYSLGVTLYELMTLCPAFEADTRDQLLLKVAVQEPRKPRRINPYLPRDLETVVLKAMEKNPEQRYQSAQLMADDLTRYLDGEPIVAVPPPLPVKVWKYVRRHKVLSASVAAAVIFLVVGGGAAWRAQELRRLSEARRLVQSAEKQEKEGRLLEALDSLKGALALDKQNVLIAAEVARVKADVRALEQARKRRETLYPRASIRYPGGPRAADADRTSTT